MGNPVSKIVQFYRPVVNNIYSGIRSVNSAVSRKRKRSEDSDVSESEVMEFSSSKKYKLDGTLNYLYKTLYLEGKDSDILVIALDKPWKLHKVYLCQSPYFESMFSGSWKESGQKVVRIEMNDPNITLQSLHVVFSSLYLHEMSFESASPVEVLATATLFQLEYLIGKCASFMVDTISSQTVIEYYEASLKYGVSLVKETCFSWLLNNLTHFCDEDAQGFPALHMLRSLSVDLMQQLVENLHFVFCGTENMIYQILLKWMAVQLNPDWVGSLRTVDHKMIPTDKSEKPFLQTELGKQFIPAFKALRIKHLIRFRSFFKNFETENIIPKSWVFPHVIDDWDKMLSVFGGCESGPSANSVSEKVFDRQCMRFGRYISQPSNQYVWRWYPFIFGVNLYWNWCMGKLTVSRAYDTRTENNRILNLVNNWKVMFRVSVYCSNSKQELVYISTSGIKSLVLNADSSEVRVDLGLNQTKLIAPVFLSVHFLPVSPKIDSKGSGETVVTEESTASSV